MAAAKYVSDLAFSLTPKKKPPLTPSLPPLLFSSFSFIKTKARSFIFHFYLLALLYKFSPKIKENKNASTPQNYTA